MAEKTKTRDITITDDKGTFNVFFRKFGGKKEYDFGGLAMVRKILSNEKARIINVLRTKKPESIYKLAKVLGRDFKSVSSDVKLLEKLGFVDLIAEKSGNRKRLRPIVVIDSMNLNIKF